MQLDKAKKTIYESEAIIKGNENLIGMGLWNIGNELKLIRDTESYKEKGYDNFAEYADSELNYKNRHCYNFISIAESYNLQSIANLPKVGITKILALSTLKTDERDTFIEENPVEDMTTRELRQAIKEKKELEQKIEELENKQPKIIEVEKVVQVIPDDYEYFKKSNSTMQEEIRMLNRKVKDKDSYLQDLLKEKTLLERKAKLNEEESKKYTQLKSQIENLSKQKDDIGRQIKAKTELSALVVRIEHLLKTELAPIKYSRAINEVSTDEIVTNNLRDIVNRVQDWCEEMYKYIGNENIVNVEVIDYE